jgi:hypothetical protein
VFSFPSRLFTVGRRDRPRTRKKTEAERRQTRSRPGGDHADPHHYGSVPRRSRADPQKSSPMTARPQPHRSTRRPNLASYQDWKSRSPLEVALPALVVQNRGGFSSSPVLVPRPVSLPSGAGRWALAMQVWHGELGPSMIRGTATPTNERGATSDDRPTPATTTKSKKKKQKSPLNLLPPPPSPRFPSLSPPPPPPRRTEVPESA